MLTAPDTVNIIQPVPDYTAPAPTGFHSLPPTLGGPDPIPKPLTSSGPSIGIGYTPPSSGASSSSSGPGATAVADANPTQLPTVTTWAAGVSSHWVLVAAIVLAVVLLLAFRRWK